MKCTCVLCRRVTRCRSNVNRAQVVLGAGKAEGSMDAAQMLKPMLARGELRCIGATTLGECVRAQQYSVRWPGRECLVLRSLAVGTRSTWRRTPRSSAGVVACSRGDTA